MADVAITLDETAVAINLEIGMGVIPVEYPIADDVTISMYETTVTVNFITD